MSNTAGASDPILMVMDELDKMADGGKTADWGLFQAANLGREYGLQILLTTQSVSNLYGLSTDFNEHITTGGLAGFPYLVSFRPGDPATIQHSRHFMVLTTENISYFRHRVMLNRL